VNFLFEGRRSGFLAEARPVDITLAGCAVGSFFVSSFASALIPCKPIRLLVPIGCLPVRISGISFSISVAIVISSWQSAYAPEHVYASAGCAYVSLG
jgi:hypothetical protein